MTERRVYAPSSRTATPLVQDIDCVAANALVIVIAVSAIGAAPSVVPLIEGIDVYSGTTWPILTAAAVTAITTAAAPRVLRIGPGITPAANLAVADLVPEKIRISMTHANSDTINYQMTLHLISN